MASTQLRSGSLQTTVTDTGVGNILDGQVTGLDVLDPTEQNEKTSLLEVDDEFDVVLSWELTGNSTPVVGGTWIVALYADDMDGQGLMTAVINHSPTGDPNKLSEMFGYAESTPIMITRTVIETN